MTSTLLLVAPTVGAKTFTLDRLVATAAALVALAGAVIGGLALARSAGGNVTRRSSSPWLRVSPARSLAFWCWPHPTAVPAPATASSAATRA